MTTGDTTKPKPFIAAARQASGARAQMGRRTSAEEPAVPCAPLSPVADQPDLLRLGTYVARQQIAIGFGDQDEAITARAVIAGILAAAQVFLSPKAFKHFVIGNEIDPTQLEALLELAHAEPESEESIDA